MKENLTLSFCTGVESKSFSAVHTGTFYITNLSCSIRFQFLPVTNSSLRFDLHTVIQKKNSYWSLMLQFPTGQGMGSSPHYFQKTDYARYILFSLNTDNSRLV